MSLTESGECPQGHLRSMLRDVREGVEPAAEPNRSMHATANELRGATSGPLPAPQSHELLSAVIGKALVIVPVAAIVAFGLWTGYEQAIGSGMSSTGGILVSVASLAAIVGGAFVFSAMTRRKR